MKEMDELKKKEAILAITQIVNIPKYKVLGHETLNFSDPDALFELPPKGTKSIAVIYLG